MKSLHPASALVGLGVAGLVVLLSSQALTPVGGYRIEYMPHPRDYVQITEGSTYTVPIGKVLVLTAVGTNYYPGGGEMFVERNGVRELWLAGGGASGSEGSVRQIANGFVAHANDQVAVTGGYGVLADDTRAWGYLANE